MENVRANWREIASSERLLWGFLGLFAASIPFSIAVANNSLSIAVVIWIYRVVRKKADPFEAPSIWIPIVVYSGATLLSAFFSRDVARSLIDSKELLLLGGEYDLCLLPWEQERERNLKAALAGAGSPEKILVVIGPEGGFADSEVAEAVGAGFLPVNLGPSIYRASTAGLAALSAIHYHFQPAG